MANVLEPGNERSDWSICFLQNLLIGRVLCLKKTREYDKNTRLILTIFHRIKNLYLGNSFDIVLVKAVAFYLDIRGDMA